MTVSSGFFNSVNHDRLYDAEQLSSIFDGIIIDGVYENYGEAFMVTANPDANSSVIIGTGRAWFDHTWTVNDSQFAMQLDPPNGLITRKDAIVIDIDRTQSVRKNSIKYITGGSDGGYPTLVNETLHKQYPIAYITRPAGEPAPIVQSNIEITVGGGECPIVTGILDAQNLENLWQQLDDEFNTWWDGIKDTLDENTVTNLTNRITALEEAVSGDNAMAGLLEKAIADKFAIGDYGLQIRSIQYNGYDYNNRTDSPKDNNKHGISNDNYYSYRTDPDPIVTLLPDKKVLMMYWTGPGAGLDNNNNVHDLWVEIRSTEGVATRNSYDFSVPPAYSDGSYTYTHLNRPAGYVRNVFLGASISSYPVKIYLGAERTEQYWKSSTRMYVACFYVVTVTIYSDGSIAISQGSPVYSSRVGSNNFIGVANAVRRSDGTKYVVYVKEPSSSAGGGYGKTDGVCYKINSDYTISTPVKSSNYAYASYGTYFPNTRIFEYNGKICVPAIEQIKAAAWCYVDPTTLQSEGYDTAYNHGNKQPEGWSADPYVVDYRSEIYDISEQNGVRFRKVEPGDESTGEYEKVSNYFCGASNLGGSLPEGSYSAVKDSNNRLWGVGPGGEQIAIGTNGGAAILKAKKSSVSINFDKNVKWLKGYTSDDSGSVYLFADRSLVDVGVYKYDTGFSEQYYSGASVIYIDKEN